MLDFNSTLESSDLALQLDLILKAGRVVHATFALLFVSILIVVANAVVAGLVS